MRQQQDVGQALIPARAQGGHQHRLLCAFAQRRPHGQLQVGLVFMGRVHLKADAGLLEKFARLGRQRIQVAHNQVRRQP